MPKEPVICDTQSQERSFAFQRGRRGNVKHSSCRQSPVRAFQESEVFYTGKRNSKGEAPLGDPDRPNSMAAVFPPCLPGASPALLISLTGP